MRRLKSKDIAGFRKKRIEEIQICPICQQPLTGIIHLDHDHKNGQIRDVLHIGCNRALGKLENALKMVPAPTQFLLNVGDYIKHHKLFPSNILHPSHRTKEEQRLLRNKRARRRRKLKNVSK